MRLDLSDFETVQEWNLVVTDSELRSLDYKFIKILFKKWSEQERLFKKFELRGNTFCSGYIGISKHRPLSFRLFLLLLDLLRATKQQFRLDRVNNSSYSKFAYSWYYDKVAIVGRSKVWLT